MSNRIAAPVAAPNASDRDQRIRTSLAQRAGALGDALGETGHDPDPIDSEALGHCRVTVQTGWKPGVPANA
jgi:hypothetical protein